MPSSVNSDPISPDPSLLAPLFETPLGLLCACVWGALWGSFFNVAIHRLAAAAVADQSETWWEAAKSGLGALRQLVYPPSHCPKCQTPIRWFDNLPLVSWLLLRGRCRHCGIAISIRYPLTELAGTALSGLVFHRFALPWLPPGQALARFIVYFFFCGVLLVLAVIDLETMYLPLAITLPALPGFFLLGRVINEISLRDALFGLGGGFGFFFLMRVGFKALFKKDGLGGGDEMLLGIIGGLLGWQSLPFTLFVGSMLGSLVSLPLLFWRRLRAPKGGDQPAVFGVAIPFGPFLVAGALVYLFFREALWRLTGELLLGSTQY